MSLNHVTEKSSVDNISADEFPLDLLSPRSVITVPLDHCSARSVIPVPLDLNKKSSRDDSLVIDSSADVVSLGLDKKLPTIADDYDSELEVSETKFVESETGEI